MHNRRSARARIAGATIVLSAGLLVAGWLDASATRRDLLALLVDQAASLRQAVAAAAGAGDAASEQLRATISARLLDNARLLAEIDRRDDLTQPLLDRIVASNRLFRVTVLEADGTRTLTSGLGGGPPPGAGRGFGRGPGAGQGAGGGAGFGLGRNQGAGAGPGRGAEAGRGGAATGAAQGAGYGAVIAERLLSGGESEAVSQVHGSRWGNGWRLSAGVRRAGGGAIVLNVDASEIAGIQQAASIDHLLADVVTRVSEVAYVILADGEDRTAHGPLAEAALLDEPLQPAEPVALARPLPGLTAREVTVADTPVLEFDGAVDPASPDSPLLRLGLRLDGLRSAQRRSLTRLVVLLVTALGLGLLALAFVGLRQEHGALQVEHARAQEALRRRDRLAAMGELASTVAHEVRNPLNAIGMSVQRLRREFLAGTASGTAADQAEQRELLDVLAAESQRINRIVQQFLEYARPPRLAFRPVDLAALLREAALGVEGLAASRSVTVRALVPARLEASVDPDQLKAAIDNLLRNAIDASPPGGEISLEAHRSSGGPVITIEDAGAGIAPEDLPRIFDLYYTTKPEGTGVGLAVTHRIVEGHGGNIDVDSKPGRGTRMTIALPERQAEGKSGE